MFDWLIVVIMLYLIQLEIVDVEMVWYGCGWGGWWMNETFTLKLTSDLHQLKDVENYLIIISAVYKLQIIQFKMRHWPYPSSSRAPMLYNFFFVPLDTPRQSAHSIDIHRQLFRRNFVSYSTNFLKQLIHLELNSSLIFIPVTSSPSKKEDIWCILRV